MRRTVAARTGPRTGSDAPVAAGASVNGSEFGAGGEPSCGCRPRSVAVPASTDWPGFRRSMTSSRDVRSAERLPRMSGSVSSGNATSNALPTSRPRNSGAVTPTIVTVAPSTTSGAPMTLSAPAEAPLPESVADDRRPRRPPRLRADRPLA